MVILVLGLSVNLFGQTDKVVGEWLLTTVKVEENVYEPYYILNFKVDGKMETMGMEVGSWKYNKDDHTIVMESTIDKDFNGAVVVQKLTKKELVVKKENAVLFYTKIDSVKVRHANSNAVFLGVWKFENEMNEIRYVKFELPDVLTVVSVFDGGNSKMNGTWMYLPKEKSIIVLAFTRFMDGKSKLIMDEDSVLNLVGKDQSNKAIRIDVSGNVVEPLNFTYEDVENSEEGEIPAEWHSLYSMVNYLKDVDHLTYRQGFLYPTVGVFHNSTLVLEYDVNTDEERISTYYLQVNGDDTLQYKESVRDNYSHNMFYPEERTYPFRVVKEETITVPAGTFNCLVIEGIGYFEERIKYWMIIDQPGVYARMIKTKEEFGKDEYRVQELMKIDLK